jgi:O-antigen/teichoic acid export membrane protein
MQANSVTADYTFAYRAFEVARLPIMIVGPIILPKFARLFNSNNDKLAAQKKRQVNKFFSLEIFFAIFMVLCLNIIWGPGIDLITKGKYGYSNSLIFFILSLCIPLQFTINLLWTLTFSAKRYKSVTIVTFITAVVNIVLDVALIHFYGGAGAAIAFLLSVCIQTAAYTFVVNKFIMRFSLLPLLVLAVAGSIAYAASVYLVPGIWSRIGIAVVVYVVLSLLSKQVGRQHLDILRLYLRR